MGTTVTWLEEGGPHFRSGLTMWAQQCRDDVRGFIDFTLRKMAFLQKVLEGFGCISIR